VFAVQVLLREEQQAQEGDVKTKNPGILSYRFGGIRVSFPVSGALQKASRDAAPSLHGDAPLPSPRATTSAFRPGSVGSAVQLDVPDQIFSTTHSRISAERSG